MHQNLKSRQPPAALHADGAFRGRNEREYFNNRSFFLNTPLKVNIVGTFFIPLNIPATKKALRYSTCFIKMRGTQIE